MHSVAPEVTIGRLRLALAMFDDGVAMMWLALGRRHPDESPAARRERLRVWLQERPVDDGWVRPRSPAR